MSFLSRCVGPFTHVVLCLDLPTQNEKGELTTRGIHIANNKEKKVTFASMKMREYGFSYLPILVKKTQYKSLESHCNYLNGRSTEFDEWGMYGLTPCSPCNKNKKKWFCSQLITFLLRECGVLSKGIDPTKISGNQLFILLFPLSSPSHLDGESGANITRADIAYKRITGLNEVPSLSEHQLKILDMD